MIYEFGDCELDDERYVLHVAGEERPIEPQVFDVLLLLVQRRGRVVTKEEILDEVWGDRFVSESALTSRIKAARRAVDDDGARQAVIRTSHGKGYEFVAAVATRGSDPVQPPSAPASTPIGSRLPSRRQSLVGRDDQLAELRTAIGATRLLTLVGPAGVGKTALGYELAREIEPDHGDGAYLCELVTVVDADATVKAVANALDVNTRLDTSLEDAIVDVLRPMDALLVLDNCEHVVERIGRLVDRVLRSAPGVTVLATSREPLGIAGEQVQPVEPLPVVADDDSGAPQPAVALFVERARAADPSFVLDPSTAPAVEEICRRLDGIPLAIELAAARTRAVDVSEIAARLDERFRLLRGVRRDVDPRHHALADAIRWSYDLLGAEEQHLFRRLSVFAGPFDLDAVEQVCAPEEDDVVDIVSHLVDRSMVVVRRHPGTGTWYELLETLRDYGRQLLPDQELVETSRRHVDHHLRLATQVERAAQGPDEHRQTRRADRAFADLRAAQRAALETGDLDRGFALIAAIREFSMRSMRYEALGWADRAVESPGAADHPLFPTMLGLQAYSSWIRGEFDRAIELAERAASTESGQGLAPSGLAERVVGNVRFVFGDYEAGHAMTERQLELAEASGVPSRIVHATYMHSVATSVRDRSLSRALARRAHDVAGRSDNPTDLASAWVATGFSADDVDAGLRAFERADTLARSAGNRWLSTFARTEMYALLVERGDHADARHGLAEVVDIWFRAGEWSQQWLTLGRCLIALAAIGERELAAEVAGAVETRAAIGATPVVASLRDLAFETASDLQRDLGGETYERHRALGAVMRDVDVVHRTRQALLGRS